ncbi:putative receptor-like protein kinase [Senna tora]|uniref:Putative receptor-like protein kinase n=1 Tax=Senna tora TaxID=362788 RepID=A0A834SW22_9FABA|nr:putative receptor-like protein kinase [Senna tora]
MSININILVLLSLILFLSHLTILAAQAQAQAQPPEFSYSYCYNDGHGNYTNTSTYYTNLHTLLSNLTSNTQIDYGFYNLSYGQSPDRVSAIGLCRGDVKVDTCRSCLQNASILLPQTCPYQRLAVAGYDECMLRYSNLSILGGVLDTGFTMYLRNQENATDVDKYKEVVSELLGRLRVKAAGGDSRRKFAAANQTGPSFQTIFGAVQCTPDLSHQDCSDCLVKAISRIPNCCETKTGGSVIKLSCNIRFDNARFYDPAYDQDSAQASADPPISSTGNSNKSRTVIIIIVVAVVAFILLVILICIYFIVKRRKKTIESEAENDDEIKPTETLHFDFETIRLATDNFSDANKLGEGGFGPVYKQPPQFRYSYCYNDDHGNYTNTSRYYTNLHTLLSNLTSNTLIDYGFYNLSFGQSPDRVSAIGLCRGDVKVDTCRSCLQNASILLPQTCPYQKLAVGGYDECMLRYSNLSILGGVLDTGFSLCVLSLENATDVDKYKQVVSELLGSLREKAAAGDSRRKFAAANQTGPSFQTVFGAVQCTPDLSEQDCSDCLVKAISEIPNCCDTKIGGNSNKSRTVIIIVVPIVAFILLVVLICIYFVVKKGKKTIESEAENDDEIKPTETLHFDFETIRLATDDFSDANKLGEGGFGPVYKYPGKMLVLEAMAIQLKGQNPNKATKFLCCSLAISKISFLNSVAPCPELLEIFFTAICLPSGRIP